MQTVTKLSSENSSIVYFPFIIGAFSFLVVSVISKIKDKNTELTSNFVATTSIFEVAAWLAYAYVLYLYIQEGGNTNTNTSNSNAKVNNHADFIIYLYIALLALGVLLLTNLFNFLYFNYKIAKKDEQFLNWLN